jgi:hypothetical protein
MRDRGTLSQESTAIHAGQCALRGKAFECRKRAVGAARERERTKLRSTTHFPGQRHETAVSPRDGRMPPSRTDGAVRLNPQIGDQLLGVALRGAGFVRISG